MEDFKYVDHWLNLDFDEKTHTYKVLGRKLKSVSSCLKHFHLPFNKDLAKFVAMSRTKNTGKKWTKGMVLKEWRKKAELAAENGTRIHNFAELYAWYSDKVPGIGENIMNYTDFQSDKTPQPTCDQERGVIEFWNDLNDKYYVVALEQMMYLQEFGFAGTADVILYNRETGKFVIVDYKTNETLFKDYGNKLLAPFQDIEDTKFTKYCLQFAHYQIIFESVGYEVEDRWLIWLQPDEDGKLYQKLIVPDYSKKLKEYYESKNDRSAHFYFT